MDFVIKGMEKYKGLRHTYAFCDHPETIMNGIAKALNQKRLPVQAVHGAKEEIRTRYLCTREAIEPRADADYGRMPGIDLLTQ